MRIMGIDVGMTTGVCTLETKRTGKIDILTTDALGLQGKTIDDIVNPLKTRINEVLPDVVVIEFTVVAPTNAYYFPIISLEAFLRFMLVEVCEKHTDLKVVMVKPGQWKATPAKRWTTPTKLPSVHLRDAARMAYWYHKFGG